MAMTVSYSVVPRKNPAKKDEPAKYYAQAQSAGELDFEELCEAITSRSTCTETDVRASISGILYEAKRSLKAGRIVRLGDLGSLQIGLTSEGAESVKEFATSMIKGAHIIFRPGKQLAELLKILSYQQVRTRAAAQSGDGSDGGNGGSGNGDGGSGDKGDGGSGDGGSDNNGEAPDPAE
ncbi:HU family DNA-binding protein [Bacteroides finegoldii]|uniref:HU family DNA-binding protein n=1 Tax=Bacteroides finegoldii TaxID=338188 RepID=UPI00189DC0EF|nr:HU family DNA-binding protein [Bacteroides finegoldii]